jgi:hypothetical protein
MVTYSPCCETPAKIAKTALDEPSGSRGGTVMHRGRLTCKPLRGDRRTFNTRHGDYTLI